MIFTYLGGYPVEDDPLVAAFLAFLENDMKVNPVRITRLSKRAIAQALRLTKSTKVSDNDRIPDHVSF